MGSRVEPSITPAEPLHVQLAPLKISAIDIGDFELASGRRLEPGGNVDIHQNYARIGSASIDALFAKASAELDPQKAIALGNQIDTEIWKEVHSLTLYQRPQLVFQKKTLANFGAFGFASTNYEDIGFTKP